MKEIDLKNSFIQLLREAIVLILIMSLVPILIYVDVEVLGNGISEFSLTEILQSLLILISSVLFIIISITDKQNKKVAVGLAGLFTAMFVREGDYFLDKIADNMWQITVVLIFLMTIYHMFRANDQFLTSLLNFSTLRSFPYILIGLLIIILFSRIFGTGSLWRIVLGTSYSHLFKTAIQEGLELLGYLILFVGVVRVNNEIKASLANQE